MSEITWHKHGHNLGNRISHDGRWLILHPKNGTTKSWELYDNTATKPWQGDWPTLAAAQAHAAKGADHA